MSKFDVPIDKESTCDATIDEVLKSVAFQNKHNNLLVQYDVQATRVILTYEGE